MDARQVDAGREHLPAQLDLVDEHVRPSGSVPDLAPDVVSESDRIAETGERLPLQVDFDNPFFRDAGRKKMPLEELEQQKTLAAAPNAGQDFDETVVLGRDKPFQVGRSFDCHFQVPGNTQKVENSAEYTQRRIRLQPNCAKEPESLCPARNEGDAGDRRPPPVTPHAARGAAHDGTARGVRAAPSGLESPRNPSS